MACKSWLQITCRQLRQRACYKNLLLLGSIVLMPDKPAMQPREQDGASGYACNDYFAKVDAVGA